MKKNMLVAAGITLALAFFLNDSRAQNNPPPASPTPGASAPTPGQPAPGAPMQRPMMPPRSRGPMVMMRAISDLKMVKMELQHSQDDYGGHKDSAIEAVDKALQELEAVRKAMPMPTPPPRVGQSPAPAPAPPSAPPATTPPQ